MPLTDLFDVERIGELEHAFGPEFAISVSGDNIYHSTHNHDDVIGEIFLELKNGTYTSSRDQSHGKSLIGLGGLKFWFQSLRAHLPPYNPNKPSSVAIYVVGTHLDEVDHEVDGTPELRRFRIEEIAKKIGMNYPLHIFETSTITMDGITSLRASLFETMRAMPHMGEHVPRPFLEFLDKIKSRAQTLKKENSKHLPCLI